MLCAPVAAQTVQQPAPPKVEHALRERVDQFYRMQVDRKLRESEKLIAPESRDGYFAGEKPEILDFQIQAIQWRDNFTKANVTMVSKMHTRRAIGGEMVATVPYASHWELIHGKWFWFIPKVNDRQTAFGDMHIDQKEIEKHQLDLKKMIQSGPTAQDVMRAVKLDRNSIVLSSAEPQTIKLMNTLSGPVDIQLVAPQKKGFEVSISKTHLGAHEEAVITVTPGNGEQVDGTIGILVTPINQNLTIQVTVPAKQKNS